MTAAQSHARLTALVANDHAEIHVLLAARNEEGTGFVHQKVDMGAQVAAHFLRAARKAAASRDATMEPVQFQPGDYPSIPNLIYLAPREVPGVDAAVAAMEPLQNQHNFGGDQDFQRKLAYYVIRVSDGNRLAYFFHRASKKLELVQKGLLVRLHDHRFNQVQDRLFLFQASRGSPAAISEGERATNEGRSAEGAVARIFALKRPPGRRIASPGALAEPSVKRKTERGN
ncbi:MAG TPA: hypothetical protein VI796_01840 [Candidatus Thermoplasmatota archaeon]|nr:hypothetical protein [Candidatus Thermoplasmatota archaeon]